MGVIHHILSYSFLGQPFHLSAMESQLCKRKQGSAFFLPFWIVGGVNNVYCSAQ